MQGCRTVSDAYLRGTFYVAFYLSLLCSLLALLAYLLDLWLRDQIGKTPSCLDVYRVLRRKLVAASFRVRTKGSCSSDANLKG